MMARYTTKRGKHRTVSLDPRLLRGKKGKIAPSPNGRGIHASKIGPGVTMRGADGKMWITKRVNGRGGSQITRWVRKNRSK